jgi:N4-(beta-N-acetylglucosaminyl)-L-asparaginase
VKLAKERAPDEKGRPKFDLHYYAITKDGRYGSAAIWSGEKGGKGQIRPNQFAVCDARGPRLEQSAYLYKRD